MNAQELEWNDLHVVLALCRSGTLSGAARDLGVNHSTVFRRIIAIEKKIDVRLFERLASGYAMTEAGELMFASAERVETEVFGLSRKLIGGDLRLSGYLQVTAPDALTIEVLMPHIAHFCKTYPRIELDLTVENGFLDLSQREVDVAIRSTNKPPDMAVGRRLCKLGATIYGSARYIEEQDDRSIAQYAWLMPRKGLDWFSVNQWLERCYKNAHVTLRSNTLLGLFEAVKLDLGVAPLPFFMGDLETDLKRVIEPPKEFESELWVLIHPDLRRSARVSAFVDFMTEAISHAQDIIEG